MQMRFGNVSLRGMGIALPDEEITSAELERRLEPTYRRLGLVEGRLELMTGIRARRHFPKGTMPSDIAAGAAEDLFRRCPEARSLVDCVVHASVCRNFVEPATAAVVHDKLRLSPSCLALDVSNACLSWMNGLVLAAGLLESGQARAALVVCGEDARSAVDTTIAALNADESLTRRRLKPSLATLTLGSGGAAALLTRGDDDDGARLLGGAFSAATSFHTLCRGGVGDDLTTESITMETDSETMLVEGVGLAARTWEETRAALEWSRDTPAAYFTHQVGSAHRRSMMERLELDARKDFSTFPWLGNMGAASVPVTLAVGAREGRVKAGDSIALLGIGSGLVCGMLGVRWGAEVSV